MESEEFGERLALIAIIFDEQKHRTVSLSET